MGQPQVWYSVGQIWNFTPENFYSGVFTYLSISSLLYLWNCFLEEKVHSMVLTASGHSLLAWSSRVRLARVNYLIMRSTIYYCW